MSHNVFYTTGGVFVFGNNCSGQLGLGDRKERYEPTKLEFFDDLEIISIHCGREHTIIHTTDGVFVFGWNGSGELGLGDIKFVKAPTKLEFFTDLEIISIHCGDYHTIINTTDGLFVFGSNDYGQLGLGDTKDRLGPTKLDLFTYSEIISIHCGSRFTIINTINGLFGLGRKKMVITPKKLNFGHKILSIHCGSEYVIINTIDGLFGFGNNVNGQLGLGSKKIIKKPTLLEFFADLKIISIHCGASHVMINTSDGLYVFGHNNDGQLGLGDMEDRLVPIKLKFFQRDTDLALEGHEALEIISIYCGWDHTIINTTDGLYVFGDNCYGQLGLGFTLGGELPTKLDFNEKIILLEERKKRIKSCMSFDC